MRYYSKAFQFLLCVHGGRGPKCHPESHSAPCSPSLEEGGRAGWTVQQANGQLGPISIPWSLMPQHSRAHCWCQALQAQSPLFLHSGERRSEELEGTGNCELETQWLGSQQVPLTPPETSSTHYSDPCLESSFCSGEQF